LQFKNRLITIKNRLLCQPLWKIQLTSFVLVALIPILFLSINLYRLAWDNAWREIAEKHQLLAMNMAAPIKNYVTDHQAMLKVITHSFQLVSKDKMSNSSTISNMIESAFQNFPGYQSIALLNTAGETQFLLNDISPLQNKVLSNSLYLETISWLKQGKLSTSSVSGITSSPITNKPTIIITEPVFNPKGKVIATLLAELKIDAIEVLRKNIHFGDKGHSAIVDGAGHVIAHPNPDWMVAMKDLSHLSIVQNMMLDKTGVTEFYSPFIKSKMVAGYTSIEGLGWGIMVPQPKSEVERQIAAFMYSSMLLGVVGLLFAFGLSWLLIRWISTPIAKLSQTAFDLSEEDSATINQLPSLEGNAPKEIQQLRLSICNLVKSQRNSQQKVKELNLDLQNKVNQATNELRQANLELEGLVHTDYLTGLASRRYFIDKLILNTQHALPERKMCVLLIDLDNFKKINDSYGHNAGDQVLMQISALFKKITKSGDIAARYGGDEFAAILYCPITEALAYANEFRRLIEQEGFEWQEQTLKLTLSIGVFAVPDEGVEDVLTIIEKVDKALYCGKKSGRNNVTEYEVDEVLIDKFL
jgi:diguanylate cyclase (GGDEF)-like protein